MNPVVKLAASALPGEKKYILFVGAGVSKDAGIPTAWDLMLKTAGLLYVAENDVPEQKPDLEEWFIKSNYAQMEYSELMGIIYPNYPDQQSFLKQYLGNHEIGEVHRAIVELARREIIRAIITTNFDHYIEKALEESELESQIISTDEDLKNSEPLIHCRVVRIYKPHGNLGHGALKNTPKDLEKLSPAMEKELTRIISEHGLIVLGYSGRDKDMQKIFKERNYSYYPLFWVNPRRPEGKMETILKEKDYTYIPCKGANQFITDFLRLLERLKDLAPEIGSGPTISDIKYDLASSREPVSPLYLEYFEKLLKHLERIKPDFSKFDQFDEAIVTQIKEGVVISLDFIEAASEASKYKQIDAIKTIYSFFGKFLKLYDPDDFPFGQYRGYELDGYKFLVYEMFVSLIATLMKYDNWDIIADILSEDIWVDKKHEGEYVSIFRISHYVHSLDEMRNKRLNLRRISVMGDIIKERFTQTELSEYISHKEFLEADYFLFMRTVCHQEDLQYLWNVWCPRSCVWLERPPTYIQRAESKKFLKKIAKAAGFEKIEEFTDKFKRNHSAFERYFISGFKPDPLAHFDFDNLGSRV